MLLRTRLSTLAAGVVACCATATAVLPAQAFAAPAAVTAAPAPAVAPAAPTAAKTAGPSATGTTTGSEEPAAPAVPLPPALIGERLMGGPAAMAATGAHAQPKSLAARAPSGADAAAAAQACTPADFAGRTGTDLVAFIKSSTPECIRGLYSSGGTDPSIFQQSRMLSVAGAFKDLAAGYTGDNSTGILQLALYLQVGYYIQFYYPDAAGPYTGELTTAVRAALDTFFAGARWHDVTESNGIVLRDVVWLTDSANVQAGYLGVYKRILDDYNNSYNAVPKMVGAVNSVLQFPLWRGNSNPDFVKAVAADPSLAHSLADFAINHKDLLSGPNAVLDTNAGNDLARMAGSGPAVEAAVKPLVRKVLDSAPLLTPAAPLYVHTAVQAAYYNGGQCSYYDICNLPAKLTSVVLPNQLVCDNRTLQAQALSADELATVCASLRNQDAFFHNVVKDNGPIPNQYAKNVTFGIFANKTDYTTYSWAIFGNDTDNGGQTVMDASDPNARAATVMYQKTWNNNDPARVWNLNHEYTHYLDSVHDLKGNYPTQMSVPDIWWVEGLAEYVSHSYRGATDTDAMGRNCSRSGRAATAGNLDYLYVYLPAGTTTLKVTTSGGTGTAHLYYNPGIWASPSAYTASSTNAGTTQSLTITNPTAGYRYLSLYAVTDFSGVTISTEF
ncbi:collagenase [Kitasatospora sp. NPDC093102]|uniref:collagenase n=1 Tax=Kitasatospora sp. NPDC093102 TaxID=3155069 RepID=UPI00341CF9FA